MNESINESIICDGAYGIDMQLACADPFNFGILHNIVSRRPALSELQTIWLTFPIVCGATEVSYWDRKWPTTSTASTQCFGTWLKIHLYTRLWKLIQCTNGSRARYGPWHRCSPMLHPTVRYCTIPYPTPYHALFLELYRIRI